MIKLYASTPPPELSLPLGGAGETVENGPLLVGEDDSEEEVLLVGTVIVSVPGPVTLKYGVTFTESPQTTPTVRMR